MAKTAKVKARASKSKTPVDVTIWYVPTIGDKHDVDGVACVVKIVNVGIGFLFPIVSDPEDHSVINCLCYGKVYADGKAVRL